MFHHKLFRRSICFLFGILCMGLGIALTTKSNLGTSPISSVPYVCSLIVPLTFGQFTFLLSLIFFTIERLIVGSSFSRIQYTQLLVGPFFGFFTDLGMWTFASVNPDIYVLKMIVLLLGTALLALGIYLQVIANVIVNPGEGVVKAIAFKTHIPFGNIKIAFDTTLATIACVLSLLCLSTIEGIREGTIINALLVGSTVKFYHWFAALVHFENWLLPKGLIYLKRISKT